MTTPIKQDAQNRAARTLYQGLLFDVAAAVALVLFTAFSDANAWGDFEWQALGFLLGKTAVVTGLSYLMRTVFDRSSIPTPLPPEYPGEPSEDTHLAA